MELYTCGPEDTRALGRRLAELARPGDLVLLEGELGSGKTTLVQGIGEGLGVRATIHSPTFVIAHEHPEGRLPLYHLDVYRMRGPSEAIGLGLDDYLDGRGLVVIEWAERIRPALPDEFLRIKISYLDEVRRAIEIEGCGARYQKLAGELGRSQEDAAGN